MPTTPRPKRTNGNGASSVSNGSQTPMSNGSQTPSPSRPRSANRRPARPLTAISTDGSDEGSDGSSSADGAADPKDVMEAPEVPSEDVLEFLKAVDDYKRKAARPFPSLSEYLRILRGLGYRKS